MEKFIRTNNVTEPHSRIQICRMGNAGKVFEIADALKVDLCESKILFIILEYGPDNRVKQEARHWIDEVRAKALFSLIVERQIKSVVGLTPDVIAQAKEAGKQLPLYEEMKGRETGGDCQSRQLAINFKPSNKAPYIIGIKNGDGAATANGAVRPAGQAKKNLYVTFSEFDLYALARETLKYIERWEARHYDQRQEARQITFVPPGWQESRAMDRAA